MLIDESSSESCTECTLVFQSVLSRHDLLPLGVDNRKPIASQAFFFSSRSLGVKSQWPRWKRKRLESLWSATFLDLSAMAFCANIFSRCSVIYDLEITPRFATCIYLLWTWSSAEWSSQKHIVMDWACTIISCPNSIFLARRMYDKVSKAVVVQSSLQVLNNSYQSSSSPINYWPRCLW